MARFFLLLILIYLTVGTTNSGSSWTYACMDFPQIYEFDFATEQVGIAVGRGNNISRTSDAGFTWSTIPVPYTCFQASFPTSTDAFAVSRNFQLLYSSNASLTWVFLPNGLLDESVEDMHFIDKDIGIVAMPGISATGQTANIWLKKR